MNLGNLKLGQSRTTDAGVTVTKTETQYQVDHPTLRQETAVIFHDKATKAWYLSVVTPNNATFKFEGATAKTIVDLAMARWDEALAEFEAHQEAEAGAPAEITVVDEIIAEDADENDTLDYEVSTQGGHTAHRASALGAIAAAMGGEVTFSQADGPGYRGQAMIHVLAPRETIKAITETLDEMVEIMEAQAAKISRDVSSAARAAGKHHSIHGCHARRGFLAGFGLGVARQIAGDEFEAPEIVTLQAFTQEHYEAGLAFGGSRVL